MASGKANQSSVPNARAVFEILVHEHADMLDAYLRTLMGPGQAHAVDDLFQEAMLVAWRRLGEHDPAASFAAWLRGIARVLVLEHFRKLKARPLASDPVLLDAIDERFGVFAEGPSEPAFAGFAVRADRLKGCMERLPAAMREAVDLVYARSLTIAAAARSVNESEETLKKRVQRARRALAECLGLSVSPEGAP